ncbi:MAG: vitamin B12 transporter [Candidatus Marinamargulisbacteria bacterium]|jgi:vitamin B12 transporter
MKHKILFILALASLFSYSSIYSSTEFGTGLSETADDYYYYHSETIFYPEQITTEKTPLAVTRSIESVQVISGEELSRLGIQTVTEALNLFGSISAGNAGGIRSLFMQGFSSGQYKLFLDGVDLKDANSVNGAPYINGISVSDIDRIEVVPGAKGTLYGSQAVAGVVQIFTKEGPGLTARIQGGPLFFNTGFRFGQTIGNLDLSFSTEKSYDERLSKLSNTAEKDPIDRENYGINATYALDKSTMHLSYKSNRLTEALDSSFGGVDDPNYTTNSKQDLLSASLDLTHNDRLSTHISYTRADLDRRTSNAVDTIDTVNTETTHYQGHIDTIDLRNHYALEEGKSLTIGFDTEKETATYNDAREYGFGPSVSLLSDTSQTSFGAYSQAKWDNDMLNLGAGFRYESYFGKRLVAYNIKASRALEIIPFNIGLSHNKGFRKPGLYERFNSGVGTENLGAETAISNEISVFQNWDKWSFRTGYFQNKINNLITTTALFSASTPIYSNTFINSTEKMESKGFSTELTFQSKTGVIDFFRFSYTATDSKTGAAEALKIPESKVVATMGLNFNPVMVGINYLGTGKQFYSFTKVLAAYDVVNVNINYLLSESETLSLKFNNVLGETYEAVQSYQTFGREFLFGYTLSF